jgi:hypothetical protein
MIYLIHPYLTCIFLENAPAWAAAQVCAKLTVLSAAFLAVFQSNSTKIDNFSGATLLSVRLAQVLPPLLSRKNNVI